MVNNLLHIAISSKALALLIEHGYIHAVDCKCLDFGS